MKLFTMGKCVVIFLLTFCYFASGGKIQEKLMVDELRNKFFILENELWDIVLTHGKHGELDEELEIAKKMQVFDNEIQKMTHDSLFGLTVSEHIHSFLHLYADLKSIEKLYTKFRQYLPTELSANEAEHQQERIVSADDIIFDILNAETGVEVTMNNVYNLTFGANKVLWEMYQEVTDGNFPCKNFNQPPQQAYYNLYNSVATTALKAYIMQQFAYLTQKLYEKGNQSQVAIQKRKEYEQSVKETMISFQSAMMLASKVLWRCDPSQHVEGETYEQFTKLLQGHIQNEVDINPGRSCTKTCNDYAFTKAYGCYDYDSDYCRKMKRCNGDLVGCHYVESHMTACISPSHSTRRYEYVKFSNGRRFGKEVYCTSNNKVKSWNRWFVHCTTCICLCDEQSIYSDRFVNLRPVMANVKENMVITGLRFVKVNRIMHLQIQEGQLLPYGNVNVSTVRWVPVDDYKINDDGVYQGKDFQVLTYNQRSMLLDTLRSHEDDYLITGIKFEMVDKKLSLQVTVEKFDFKNGTLLGNDYHIYGTGHRIKLDLSKTDIPTKSPASRPNFESNRYVEFTNTGFDVDAAQTTVPFFDSQPVFCEPAVPLQSIGIYYKGKPGYGGFVAPRISTYDFSKHMVPEFPEVKNREEAKLIVPIN